MRKRKFKEGRFGIEPRIKSNGENRQMALRRIGPILFCFFEAMSIDKKIVVAWIFRLPRIQ
jgi:hypothetical protein